LETRSGSLILQVIGSCSSVGFEQQFILERDASGKGLGAMHDDV